MSNKELIDGKYRKCGKPLGNGSFGVVFKVENVFTGEVRYVYM